MTGLKSQYAIKGDNIMAALKDEDIVEYGLAEYQDIYTAAEALLDKCKDAGVPALIFLAPVTAPGRCTLSAAGVCLDKSQTLRSFDAAVRSYAEMLKTLESYEDSVAPPTKH
ncbi:hypothetical protein [Escherichia coli]|uniref:hypothetical protein n=1 Tax=Escherichia coli TaxID=562 RepID=UPI0010CB0808|nr:hypothetical protein [Escherichia coli]EEX3715888.1 hypothetical protein [Escherichia coli]EEX9837903.1 hypothetical protein [Escherichia coli]EJN5908073.1 hypothetical protein [Escherichia coli]GDQ36422.1 hypothetical protein BvCmsNSP052_04929 [Escherichia coli]